MSADDPSGRSATAATSFGRCRNCGAELKGRFCSNCSQAADVHVPSTRELLHEAFEGLTHSDSRLWRTLLWLWFKPGRLTQAFVEGRRMSYLPPFRLYLVLSVVFFLLASISHTSGEIVTFDTAEDTGKSDFSCADVNFITLPNHLDWNQRISRACNEIVRDHGRNLAHVALATMPKAMFIFLPLVAFLHMLMYWRPRHRYAEHLLFFIHVHAFFFSVAIVFLLCGNAAQSWPGLRHISSVVQMLLLWCLPVYTLLAMRRVFRRSWLRTGVKAFALCFVYFMVLFFTLAGVLIYAALQL